MQVIYNLEARSTDTHLIWTPVYNGQFCLSQQKEYNDTKCIIFSLKLTQTETTDTEKIVNNSV